MQNNRINGASAFDVPALLHGPCRTAFGSTIPPPQAGWPPRGLRSKSPNKCFGRQLQV